MPAISGKEFMDRIDRQDTEIWLDGKKVSGKLSNHPAFKGVLKEKAHLYDQQLGQSLTYTSPQTGDPVGLSYLQPKSKEDLIQRRHMIEAWAQSTYGLMGRSPDYMNTVVTAFASSIDYLEGKENCFPENIKALYERAREDDLSFTHTFVNPQVNRSQLNFEDSEEPISARMVDENEDGIIIKGARLLATQGGLTDEVLVFSAGGVLDPAHAFAFSIPSDTKGLKFICRPSFVGGESKFDHPLSTRYDEMDTILVFDNVLVPWDRVFFYNNLEVSNSFMIKSSFQHLALHQVLTRQVVKLELVLGIAETIVQTINIGEYQHIQEKVAEIITCMETMKALLLKSEQEAELDDWGYMRPNINPLRVASSSFPKIYPHLTEILQLLGASGMVTIPSEKDFASPIQSFLNQYVQGKNADAETRVKIFRLAWDLTMSAFGTRETLYERYFFGDPIRLSSMVYKTYPKEEFVDRVKNFLDIEN
ncbi:4-hydroxyphenylacetate 3-monooxygenase, oxygenase component [Radiobacillus kanasensis]|uniref:4-hydroxyphenylacetate 3-monooxygenase, oxygenase component n=1 Tax=Radiobacillus kanasensis TaxID=2844358 RepID=UPI001E5714EA|nr:4-hydroxyphenylacetate 3-monooxygenase, oxygenase component [Radiobacillus kanasensis]UFU00313.1 4-hydroxyphenylacetate 3-monooxygenase, oxygenase component [Radiobacillus kanasensis]